MVRLLLREFRATPREAYLCGVANEHVCYLLPNNWTNIAAILELHQLRYVRHRKDNVAAKPIGT